MHVTQIFGAPCHDGLLDEFDTNQYSLALLVLWRLATSERCGAVDDPSRKSLSKADRVRVGKRGFFSKQRAIKIDLRPSNTIKIGPGPEAGVDPGRGDGG